jgi:hypothetical protein
MHGNIAERTVFGVLPLVAGCCDGQIGAVNAVSFAERIASCTNLAVADDNTLFHGKALNMLVVLRMNRSFMVFMWKNLFFEIKALQPFNMAVVVPDIEETEGRS